MVVLVRVIDTKANDHLVKKSVLTIFLTQGIEVFAGVENEFIVARNKVLIFQQGAFTSAIRIGSDTGNQFGLPGAVEVYADRCSGSTVGNI